MVARAVVFDVMGTLFDLAPVRRRLSELGAPEEALEAWFGRMLHSAASLTLVGEFHPFREIGRTTLLTTLAQLDVEPDQADEVLRALGNWIPAPTLRRLSTCSRRPACQRSRSRTGVASTRKCCSSRRGCAPASSRY